MEQISAKLYKVELKGGHDMIEVVLGAIFSFIWSVIVSVVLYPIGAIGQVAHSAVGFQRAGYHGVAVDRARSRALLGVVVLALLWAVAYFLWGLIGLLVVGGVTLTIVVLGWFDLFVVPE
jgi:hypothetical protein